MKMHTNHLCLKGDTFKFQVQSRPDDYRAFLLVASNCPNMTPRKFCFLLNRTSDNLLWQSVTSRSIFVNGAGSRGQSLTEVEGRINGENKGILPAEQRAAGFCCVPAGWSFRTLRLRQPVKSYTAAAVSAKTRGKDKNTSKAGYAFEELSFKTWGKNRLHISVSLRNFKVVWRVENCVNREAEKESRWASITQLHGGAWKEEHLHNFTKP